MTAVVGVHPQKALQEGRYRLDSEGRLHPERFGVIKAVAMVTVRCKPALAVSSGKLPHPDRGRLKPGPKPSRKAEAIRAECTVEAAERASRVHEAKRLTTAHPLPVTSRTREIDRPLARRKVEPSAPAVPNDEDVMTDFSAALARVQGRRRSKAHVISKPAAPKIDGKAVADAYARKHLAPPPAKKPPTRRALGTGECIHCGIPGRKGCDHFLPYEGS
ncbi:hypothetical protein ACQEPB_00395 [Novosphingobium fluoreni]|uniref:hypothetical protein n=1 Tax=Novosphingobium fluoreni TaxID=1391222 RepID=UPI003DA14C5F